MKVFLDTNVILAAAIKQHPHFVRAEVVFQRCVEGEDEGVVHAHSLFEFHSAATQLPGGLAIPPPLVDELLDGAILPFVKTVALTARQVREAQARAGRQGLIGGIVYDFYHLAVAEKEGVDRLYTFTPSHFRRIAGPEFEERIVAP